MMDERQRRFLLRLDDRLASAQSALDRAEVLTSRGDWDTAGNYRVRALALAAQVEKEACENEFFTPDNPPTQKVVADRIILAVISLSNPTQEAA